MAVESGAEGGTRLVEVVEAGIPAGLAGGGSGAAEPTPAGIAVKPTQPAASKTASDTIGMRRRMVWEGIGPSRLAGRRAVYRDAMHHDDELDDLGRELRERMGEEMRLEAEMLERDSALVERRRRRLADLAIELVSRGDTVSAIAGDKTLRGRLIYARGEIASIVTGSGTADLHLAAGVVLRIDERRSEGGTAPRSGSDTLRARLLEYEMAEQRIEIWVPAHRVEVAGVIAAVGKDHLVVTDQNGTEWVTQLADIAWVKPH